MCGLLVTVFVAIFIFSMFLFFSIPKDAKRILGVRRCGEGGIALERWEVGRALGECTGGTSGPHRCKVWVLPQ